MGRKMACCEASSVSFSPPAASLSLPSPRALLLLQAVVLLLMAGAQEAFVAATNPSSPNAPGAPLPPQVPSSSSNSSNTPAAAAAAGGAPPGSGLESAGSSPPDSQAAHAAAAAPATAPSPVSVCFHLRNFGFPEGKVETAGEGVGGDDPNPSHEPVVSFSEVCVKDTQTRPPSPLASRAASAGGEGEDGWNTGASSLSRPTQDLTLSATDTPETSSSVSAARKQFYLSSPSGSDWLLQLRETLCFRRRELLHEPSVLKALAGAALPGWSGCARDAVSLRPISGGLSNKLYLVELHAPQQQEEESHGDACGDTSGHGPLLTKALIRVYGHQEGTALFNAKTEQELFKALGSLGIAPRCLAEFEGGRFEEFWEASPLTTKDLKDVKTLEKAAKLISSFHEVNLPGFDCSSIGSFSCHQTSGAGAGESQEETRETKGGNRCLCCCCLCRLELWGRLALEALSVVHQQTGLHAAAATKASSSSSTTTTTNSSSSSSRSVGEALLLQKTASRLDALRVESYVSETSWMASQLREAAASDEVYFKALGEALRRDRRRLRGGQEGETGGGDDPLENLFWLSGTYPVLSHNDFQENNILQTPDGQLKLIDFEYSGVNARAFDLGNLFCEATLDYTDNPDWPFYSHRPENMPSPQVRRHLVQVYLQETLQKKGLADLSKALLTDETIDRFMRVVDLMILMSHLAWGFWSVVRTTIPEKPDDFSYLDYAKTRLEAYTKKKREFELSSNKSQLTRRKH